MSSKRSVGVLLFDGFEVLDVFGPLEMYGMSPEAFDIFLVAEEAEAVASRQGPKSVVDHKTADGHQYDILFVPGGTGTRREVNNTRLLDWIATQSQQAELVTSVCTGSALLAKAGVLDGVQATTNKMAYEWATAQGQKVNWVKQARWVEDGKFFTSSGVSAGMDMSLAIISRLLGEAEAEKTAQWAEYEWHRDAGHDPFAAVHGLI